MLQNSRGEKYLSQKSATEAEKNRCVGVGASKKAKLKAKCRKLKKAGKKTKNMQKGEEMEKAKHIHAASEGYMKKYLRKRLQN